MNVWEDIFKVRMEWKRQEAERGRPPTDAELLAVFGWSTSRFEHARACYRMMGQGAASLEAGQGGGEEGGEGASLGDQLDAEPGAGDGGEDGGGGAGGASLMLQDAESFSEDVLSVHEFEAGLARLSSIQRLVMRLRLGTVVPGRSRGQAAADGGGLSVGEVAEVVGMTRSRVRQIEVQARHLLRMDGSLRSALEDSLAAKREAPVRGSGGYAKRS
jgi:hypothetical protein